jgi:hypothetical protein
MDQSETRPARARRHHLSRQLEEHCPPAVRARGRGRREQELASGSPRPRGFHGLFHGYPMAVSGPT